MQLEPLLLVEPCFTGIGIDPVHLPQCLKHEAHLLGEALGDLNVPASRVRKTAGEQRLELLRLVRREGVAHVDRRWEPSGSPPQDLIEVLSGVTHSGEEQHDLPAGTDRDDPGGKHPRAALLGVIPQGRRALLAREMQDLHRRVVVVHQSVLGGLPNELLVHRDVLLSACLHQVPLRRRRQRHAHPALQPLDAVERQPCAVLQHPDHGGDRLVVLLLAHLSGRRSRIDFPAQIAAQPIPLVHGGRERRHCLDPYRLRRLGAGIHLPLAAAGAAIPA